MMRDHYPKYNSTKEDDKKGKTRCWGTEESTIYIRLQAPTHSVASHSILQ